MGKRHDFKIYEELATKYLVEGLSLVELSKQSGIDRRTLSINFKNMGIEIVNKQNLTKFDEHIFDEIDNEEKAYWLGFIFADGYISSTSNNFELSLSIKDINHLEKFSKFMKYTGQIKQDSYRCRFSLRNKHLWNILNNYGCIPRKSLTLKFPNRDIFKSKDLIKHFLRGYFDGDGCITYQKDTYTVSAVCSVIGTPEFLSEFEQLLNFEKEITKCKDKRSINNTISLSFKRSESLVLMIYLYENSSIYLERKFKLYSFFKNGCRSLEEFNELLLTNIGESCDANPEIND